MNASPPGERSAGSLRCQLKHYRAGTAACLRLVYIPTHRPFENVLQAVTAEISHTARRTGDELQLLVVDDRDAESARDNKAVTAEVAERFSFPVNWLGQDEWADFVAMLVRAANLTKDESDFATAALSKETGGYGAGANKASLFAAFLGARSLHRRDSDEIPGFREADQLTALQVELAALATPVPAAENLGSVRPYFIGSDVVGEPTKDHRDLMVAAADLVTELDQISSMKRIGRPAAHFPSSAYLLDAGTGIRVERDTSGRTEIGVSASRIVSEWIPEMPAVGILGTDYFQKGLLYRLGLPVLWHPLSATHVYEPSRLRQKNLTSLHKYVIAELRYCVLKQYWNAANASLDAIAGELMSSSCTFRADRYADVFDDVLESESVRPEAAVGEFIAVYERAVTLSSGEVKARHEARCRALREVQDTTTDYVRAAVVEFAALTRLWPRLVAGARAMNPA